MSFTFHKWKHRLTDASNAMELPLRSILCIFHILASSAFVRVAPESDEHATISRHRKRESPNSSFKITEHSTPCKLTAAGSDGFGHQYEAKMSCTLLAALSPDKWSYVHTPFAVFEHTNTSATLVNDYTNIAGSHVSVETCLHDGLTVLKIDSSELQQWILNSTGTLTCNSSIVYQVDNCWDAAYAYDTASLIFTSEALLNLQKDYFSTMKPDTNFSDKRPNAVVHVRRGIHVFFFARFSIFVSDPFHRSMFCYTEMTPVIRH